MMARAGGRVVVRVGLLWRSGAGACPNLPQRRPGPGSTADESAEYQRFSFGAPARSGPLWQIWTNGAAAGPGRVDAGPCTDGGRGDHPALGPVRYAPGRRDVHFALESAAPTVILECKMHISAKKRDGRGRRGPRRRPRPHRPAPARTIMTIRAHGPPFPVRKAHRNHPRGAEDGDMRIPRDGRSWAAAAGLFRPIRRPVRGPLGTDDRAGRGSALSRVTGPQPARHRRTAAVPGSCCGAGSFPACRRR